MRIFFISLILPAFMFSCSPDNRNGENVAKKKDQAQSSIVQPSGNKFTIGDSILVEVQNDTENWQIDSVDVYVGNELVERIKEGPFTTRVATSSFPVGSLGIRTISYFNDQSKDIDHKSVALLSDVTPERFGYRVVNRFPHARRAFTQGLVYHNGYIYEGTGQQGESSLRKVDLRTGKVLQIERLASQYFGEGIAIYEDKIIQLTWQSRKGFVYNLDDFRLIREFNYSTEGWGLASDGETLYMSDGTAAIYKLDPETFAQTGKFEVYNQFGPVPDLNELEYIDGKIYANIYQTDEIAIIDPSTGKVTGLIDLSGLLELNMVNDEIDVLNGIAYDEKNDRLFVTGKYWAYVFEIDLIRQDATAYAGQATR